MGNSEYWSEWVDYGDEYIGKAITTAANGEGDENYAPQYLYTIAQKHLHQIMRRYSAGSPVAELSRYFPGLLDSWEESERLGAAVWTEDQQLTRHAWRVNFDHYIVCFWLVGLALVLEIPDEQWQRLLVLIGNEGEDILLDRVIASRSPSRNIGTVLLYPRPYARLLAAVDAPPDAQAALIGAFVEHWYDEIRTGAKSGTATQAVSYRHPYWYTYGDENFDGGAYFGRWCIEAVSVVKAFAIDDSRCLGLEHYPGDLLRPNDGSLPAAKQKIEPAIVASEHQRGWWARLLGKK